MPSLTQPDWVNIGLTSPDKKQLFDAILPYGEPAPYGGDDPSFEEAVRTRRPVVGNVPAGRAMRMHTVRVRVPVAYRGRGGVLFGAAAESFAEICRRRSRCSTRHGLVDRELNIIVRIPPVARHARLEIPRGASRPEGWFRGSTLEGRETYTM